MACEKLISPNQIAFIKGRFILESVVSAHEIIHEVHHSGQAGFIFKLDYEKAYDRVDRGFLFKMLESRGFGKKFIWLVGSLLEQESVGVRINDLNSDYFVSNRG